MEDREGGCRTEKQIVIDRGRMDRETKGAKEIRDRAGKRCKREERSKKEEVEEVERGERGLSGW